MASRAGPRREDQPGDGRRFQGDPRAADGRGERQGIGDVALEQLEVGAVGADPRRESPDGRAEQITGAAMTEAPDELLWPSGVYDRTPCFRRFVLFPSAGRLAAIDFDGGEAGGSCRPDAASTSSSLPMRRFVLSRREM